MEWKEHPQFRRGVALFNAGEPWEAHEAWEAVWKAAKESGDQAVASFVQGLIWCAAAWVKRRAGEPRGAALHADRVAARMAELRPAIGESALDVSLDDIVRIAGLAADGGPADSSAPQIISRG